MCLWVDVAAAFTESVVTGALMALSVDLVDSVVVDSVVLSFDVVNSVVVVACVALAVETVDSKAFSEELVGLVVIECVAFFVKTVGYSVDVGYIVDIDPPNSSVIDDYDLCRGLILSHRCRFTFSC